MTVDYVRTETRAATAPLEGLRASWAGIWGGFLIVMGVLVLLATLGIAVGVTTAGLGPDGSYDGKALGTGAAIWSGLSLLIALFVGGLAASRLGMVADRTNALMQGVLMWVMAILAIIWLASRGVAIVAGGAFGLMSGALQAATNVTTDAASLTSINSGTPDEVLAKLSDPRTVQAIAGATGMPQAEVRQNVSELQARVDAARDNPEQAAAEVRRGVQNFMNRAAVHLGRAADQAQPAATAGAWATFGALVLSLIAAVVGSVIGGRQAAKRIARLPAVAPAAPAVHTRWLETRR